MKGGGKRCKLIFFSSFFFLKQQIRALLFRGCRMIRDRPPPPTPLRFEAGPLVLVRFCTPLSRRGGAVQMKDG